MLGYIVIDNKVEIEETEVIKLVRIMQILYQKRCLL